MQPPIRRRPCAGPTSSGFPFRRLSAKYDGIESRDDVALTAYANTDMRRDDRLARIHWRQKRLNGIRLPVRQCLLRSNKKRDVA